MATDAAPPANLTSPSAAAASTKSVAVAKPRAEAVRQGNKVWGLPDYTDADPSKWVVIFPHYLDSARKRSGGRKISASNGVDKPVAFEVFEVVRELGLRTQLELDKAYCRDCWEPGRVRIELFDTAGSPIQPDIAKNRTWRCLHAGSKAQTLVLQIASQHFSTRWPKGLLSPCLTRCVCLVCTCIFVVFSNSLLLGNMVLNHSPYCLTGQALFLKVASLIPKFRERAKSQAAGKSGGGGSSSGGGGGGKGAAAAAPKKKKKGKR